MNNLAYSTKGRAISFMRNVFSVVLGVATILDYFDLHSKTVFKFRGEGGGYGFLDSPCFAVLFGTFMSFARLIFLGKRETVSTKSTHR